mgnify:CR=1 FL=1
MYTMFYSYRLCVDDESRLLRDKKQKKQEMKVTLTSLAIACALLGCADQAKRQKNLEVMYRNCKVEPAPNNLQGYDFIVIDSTNNISGVVFYLGSETKLREITKIR